MSGDATAPEPDAAAPARAARFAPKLLIVGGGAALALLLLIGAATWALWPAPQKAKSKTARAQPAQVAAMQAASASAALASASASAADAPLPAVEPPAVAPHVVAAAASPASTGALSPPDEVHPARRPDSRHDVPSVAAAEAEAPLDRLQRRLGEVLGPKGAVNAARNGEWRLVTRTSAVGPVAPAATPTAGIAAAQRADAREQAVHWGYEGRGGPQAWGRMKAEFNTCATGRRQSPIDIRDGLALDLEPLQFDYRPSRFGVIDTGHTVQVNLAPGNFVDINGRRFELQQFHFHRPSEERINGRQFDMDVHLVHRDADGRLAVVAVLLERGAAQPLLQTVWNNLPLEKGEEAAARTTIDLNELLPAARGYYTYMGSLTTPPCSEGVLWAVLQQPIQVSVAQIEIFSRLYPMNARPIQQAAGRLIKQSN